MFDEITTSVRATKSTEPAIIEESIGIFYQFSNRETLKCTPCQRRHFVWLEKIPLICTSCTPDIFIRNYMSAEKYNCAKVLIRLRAKKLLARSILELLTRHDEEESVTKINGHLFSNLERTSCHNNSFSQRNHIYVGKLKFLITICVALNFTF